ncbi:MAG: hypothetical protein H8D43_03590 [Chloroflexi bacterium]|nr:hypothetical protein [Chloroflexota bacterium]
MLEKRRVLCLHAAGAVWHDLGVLIVGRTARGGKTTLSLSIAIRGGQFVADEYLFYDGQHCYGCPQFKSHVRFGTLLAFPELANLVPDAVSPDRLELWDVALGCPLNLSEICGPGRVASKMVPRVILFPSLDPEASISMREIHRTEAMSLLRAESVKHIAKLWLAPGTEIGSPEEVDEIVDKLGRAGIEVSGREMMLSELVDHLPCFALSGGSNLSSLLQETERIVLSLRE